MNEIERLEAKVAALQMRLEELEKGPQFARRGKPLEGKPDERDAFSDTEVLAAVCEHVGTTVEDVRSPSRTREVSRKRAVVAKILRKKMDWGVRQIGRAMEKSAPAVGKMLN